MQYMIQPPTACELRSGGYGFDIVVEATIEQQFQGDPAGQSVQSFGLTLQQHENLHLHDYQRGLGALDGLVPTDGFTKKACNECRQRVSGAIISELEKLGATSTRRRDVEGDTTEP